MATTAVPRSENAFAEALEIATAERDAARSALRKLVAIIARAGGYMSPEQQADYLNAKALLGIGPVRTAWEDRK